MTFNFLSPFNYEKRSVRYRYTAVCFDSLSPNYITSPNKLRAFALCRPYQCRECGKSYKDSASFKRHQQTHGGGTEGVTSSSGAVTSSPEQDGEASEPSSANTSGTSATDLSAKADEEDQIEDEMSEDNEDSDVVHNNNQDDVGAGSPDAKAKSNFNNNLAEAKKSLRKKNA